MAVLSHVYYKRVYDKRGNKEDKRWLVDTTGASSLNIDVLVAARKVSDIGGNSLFH